MHRQENAHGDLDKKGKNFRTYMPWRRCLSNSIVNKHRIHYHREVTVYRLIAAGTIEEKIYQRQIFKTALSNKVLQDPRQRRLFSQKDLKDLFTLRADNGSLIAGGDGSTETSELTRGDGYVDPDEVASKKSPSDDGETMRTVLKSKGLAGVFDHDVIESSDINKKSSTREMIFGVPKSSGTVLWVD